MQVLKRVSGALTRMPGVNIIAPHGGVSVEIGYVGLHWSEVDGYPAGASEDHGIFNTRAETTQNRADDPIIHTADGTEVIDQIGGLFVNNNASAANRNMAIYDFDASATSRLAVAKIPSSDENLSIDANWDAQTDGESVAALDNVRLIPGKQYCVAVVPDASNQFVKSAENDRSYPSFVTANRDTPVVSGVLDDDWTSVGNSSPADSVMWARFTKLTTAPEAIQRSTGVAFTGGVNNSRACNVTPDNTEVWGMAPNEIAIYSFDQDAPFTRRTRHPGTGLLGIVNGTHAGWLGCHNTPGGNTLFCNLTSTGASYLYYSTTTDQATIDLGANSPAFDDLNPVLACGSTQADGSAAIAGEQITGRNMLTKHSFVNCTLEIASVETPDCIVYAEYVSGGVSTADPHLTMWYSTDDGESWLRFWQAGITTETGTQQRDHFHSVYQHPSTNEIIVCTGDTSARSSIIRGPNDPAKWAAHDSDGTNAVANGTVIADTANGFAGYSNGAPGDGQRYRGIHLLFKGGKIYYSADTSGGALYCFADTFADANTTEIFRGHEDRLTRFDFSGCPHGMQHSNGTLLMFDRIDSGANDVSEMHIHASKNGSDWFTIGQVEAHTGTVPTGAFFFQEIHELADGRIIIDGTGRFSMRNVGDTGTHTDEAIIFEFTGAQWDGLTDGVKVVGPTDRA
jgi:hypothetical protein